MYIVNMQSEGCKLPNLITFSQLWLSLITSVMKFNHSRG